MGERPFWFHPDANAEVLSSHDRYAEVTLVVGGSFDPKFRDLALAEFVVFAFCVIRENQCVKLVLVVDHPDHPGTAAHTASIDLGDRQVEIMSFVLFGLFIFASLF